MCDSTEGKAMRLEQWRNSRKSVSVKLGGENVPGKEFFPVTRRNGRGRFFKYRPLVLIRNDSVLFRRFNSWWTKITVGILLLAFIRLQRFIVAVGHKKNV